MGTNTGDILKYANVQMAAEADYSGVVNFQNRAAIEAALVRGNNRSSRFPTELAAQFTDPEIGWSVVDHKANTTTGFSGTLFKNNKTGELVLSFRSTEFIDDAARDNQETNTLEIKQSGWAFGQIADMEAWFKQLRADAGKLGPSAKFTVTGYSLGGHLATAFSKLREEEAALGGPPNPVLATYTFNGAGVGRLDGRLKALSLVISEFDARRTDGNADLFTTTDGKELYSLLKGVFAKNAQVTGADAQLALDVIKDRLNSLPGNPLDALKRESELRLLQDAITRIKSVADYAAYAPGLPNASGNQAANVSTAQIASVGLDYQLAVLTVSAKTSAANVVQGAVQAIVGRNTIDPPVANFYDVYGSNDGVGDTFSAVANSQLHYGAPTPVWIEDQPLYRGSVLADVGTASWHAGEARLLVPNFGDNDFGDTHSLVLMIDSLAVQQRFVALAPGIDSSTINTIFNAASNQRGQSSAGTQGAADGDTLERVVNGLSASLGLSGPQLRGNNSGGTWYIVKDQGGFTGRDSLHQRLADIDAVIRDQGLTGRVVIRPSTPDLVAAARNNYGAFVALQQLSPFWIAGQDPDAEASLRKLWATGRTAEYVAWEQDKGAAQPSNFTDRWITDRSQMLQALTTRNALNMGGQAILMPQAPEQAIYTDLESSTRLEVDRASAPGNADLIRRVSFGSSAAETIEGALRGDDLFGGAGDDTLDGKQGDDLLEGGTGQDRYVFQGSFGKDTVLDADGSGALQIDGVDLTGQIAHYAAISGKTAWEVKAGDQKYRYTLQSSAQSSTGEQLVVAKVLSNGETDSANTITVNNFSRAAATNEGGYLGLRIDTQNKVLLLGAGDANPLADPDAQVASYEGLQATLVKGSGRSFKLVLAGAAKEGDFLSLQLSGEGSETCEVVLGAETVSANGAVLRLREGQTEVSFALVQDGELAANRTVTLSAAFVSGDESVRSNTWSVTLQKGVDASHDLHGDLIARTVKTDVDVYRALDDGSRVKVADAGEQIFETDGSGNLVDGGSDDTVVNNVLYGSAQADSISGGVGNDLLGGGAGDDRLDGGIGDDMIAAGLGNDNITGGEGNDYIFSAANASAHAQQIGPNDTWERWAQLPEGAQVLTSGATWGVYQSAGVTHFDGVGAMLTGEQNDVIDGGAGDDQIYASWGADRAQGGDGDDAVYGLGGDDIVEGGAGDDDLNGDGPVAGGNEAVDAAKHGSDFIDGGDGDDLIRGWGAGDQLYGGAGDDTMYGDTRAASNSTAYVPLQYQGADYIDGEDGDDYAEGDGGDDTLYGGLGNDKLWGDTPADRLSGEAAADARGAGNDYLDGEEGNDTLVGGGGNDDLYGGTGDDRILGDDAAVQGQLQGGDYLDGEEGKDTLVGGGAQDTLFGGKGDDVLFGDATDVDTRYQAGDYLDGEEGNDTLVGEGGSDTLYGSQGDDQLFGDDETLDGSVQGDDFLDGGEGNDMLVGHGGADQLVGGVGNDSLLGDSDAVAAQFHGADTLDGGAGDDTVFGDGGDDLLLGGEGDDQLVGGAGADNVIGDAGNDILLGDDDQARVAGAQHGADYLSGGDGDDILVGGGGGDTLIGGAGNDQLLGDDAEGYLDALWHGDDLLEGGEGNDTLLSGNGNDTLDGGAGDDLYGVRGSTGVKTIMDEGGTDTLDLSGWTLDATELGRGSLLVTHTQTGQQIHIQGFDADDPSSVSPIEFFKLTATDGSVLTLAAAELIARLGITTRGGDGDDVLLGSAMADRLLGLGGNDTLVGQDGDDILDGGTGADQLAGGAGNDSYVIDALGEDVVLENSGEGSDTVLTGSSYTLAIANVENVKLTGHAAVNATGDGNANLLTGNDAANVLEGAGGADTLAGGAGDDFYVVNDADAAILEEAGEGTDTVLASVDYALAENVENLTLRGDALVARGNAEANYITGNAGDNRITGAGGNDTLAGGAGNDHYVFGTESGRSKVEDSAGEFDSIELFNWDPRLLHFVAGQDGGLELLDLGGGQRVAISGYEVHDPGAVSAVETLWFTHYDDEGNFIYDIVGTQTAIDDFGISFLGSSGAETLTGTFRRDRLFGYEGDDLLQGLGGNDNLDGGAGRDTLAGGTGDDTYFVDNALDRVVEAAGEGNDSIVTGVSYDLAGTAVEDMVMGAAGLTGVGNQLDNRMFAAGDGSVLYGEGGADTLTGSYGADELHGGDGDDRLDSAGSSGDRLFGDAGHDLLLGGHGSQVLDGGEGDDSLYGGYEDDTLLGGAGRDWLDGGEGSDSLDGGADGDILWGGTGGADFVAGGAGNDLLYDSDGNDTLAGGSGDDVYTDATYDDATFFYGGDWSGHGTHIVEAAGEGTDLVVSHQSFTLSDNVENLQLVLDPSGTFFVDVLAGTGNQLDNRLESTGYGSGVQLLGMDGDDMLVASAHATTNNLDGGAGADTLVGGGEFGSNDYWVDDVRDQVVAPDFDSLDTVHSAVDYTLGTHQDVLELLEGSSAAVGVGNEQGNRLFGNGNDNLLDGGEGQDELFGNAGNDTLLGTRGIDFMSGGDGDDLLVASDLGGTMHGDEGDDTLHGGGADDLLDGGSGADFMAGGAGDDTYGVDDAGDAIVDAGGLDTVISSIDYTLSSELENLTLTQSGLTGVGNQAANIIKGTSFSTLRGGGGDDVLEGAFGSTMEGGDGNDILVAASASWLEGGDGDDVYRLGDEGSQELVEGAGQGYDRVVVESGERDFRLHLSKNVEMLDASSYQGELQVQAEDDDNLIIAGAGNDAIDAGGGNDTVAGGGLVAALVQEDPEDSDRSAAYLLGRVLSRGENNSGAPSWEDLQERYGVRADLDGVDPTDYIGFLRTGSRSRVPTLAELEGWMYWPLDTLPSQVRAALESPEHRRLVSAAFGADSLAGGEGSDVLDGGAGADSLMGGAGADDLYGGDSGEAEVVIYYHQEEGTYLRLGLIAASDDDLLDGGEGLDRLRGGVGNDTYLVDGEATPVPGGRSAKLDLCDVEQRFGMDASSRQTWVTDTVIEEAGQGDDTVIATASVVLRNIETVQLGEGAGAIDATTDGGSQTLMGNSDDNTLDGGAGADVMVGGAGDDTYVVDDVGDTVTENPDEGFDIVRTGLDGYTLGENVEALVLQGDDDISGSGNERDNVLVANGGDNTLQGGGGDDILAGWTGDDLLVGGSGYDGYLFGRGHGHDVVDDTSGGGWLRFSGDIQRNELSFVAQGDDLLISVGATDASDGVWVTLRNWNAATERIDQITFCADADMALDDSVLLPQPPQAVDDQLVLEPGAGSATANVLLNDRDPNGDTLSADEADLDEAYGHFSLQADGTLIYTPYEDGEYRGLGEGESLTDAVAYTVHDPAGLESGATAWVELRGVNDAPDACSDDDGVDGEYPSTGWNLLANDSDPDHGDSISVLSVGEQQGVFGKLLVQEDGEYVYSLDDPADPKYAKLADGEMRIDEFVYTIADTHGLQSRGTLSVEVWGLNDAPEAMDDAGQADTARSVTGNLLANDTDVDEGDVLTAADAGVRRGTFGLLDIAADGSFSYTVDTESDTFLALGAGEHVLDSFEYTVVDAWGASATATLSIDVEGLNDGPVAADDATEITEDAQVVLAGNLLDNDCDPDASDVLSVATTGTLTGRYGRLTLQADGGYSYALDNASVEVQSLGEGQAASDSFSYTVADRSGAVATASLKVDILGANDAPVSTDEAAAVAADGALTASGNVLDNDRDPDTGDTLTIQSAGSFAGQYGQLTLAEDGSYSYALDKTSAKVRALGAGQTAIESFAYTIADSQGATASATLTVQVAGANDAPVAAGETAAVSEDGTLTASGNVLANDHDADSGDTLSVQNAETFSGQYGQLTLDANGGYSYKLNNEGAKVQALGQGQSVTDTFSYTASDAHGAISAATLTVQVAGVNDAPVAAGETAAVSEDGTLTASGNVLANDHDADAGDTLSVQNAGTFSGQYGQLTLAQDGSYTYALDNGSSKVQSLAKGQTAIDSFSYVVADSHGSAATATLAVSIAGADEAQCGVVLTGTARNDTLTGTDCADKLDGRAGADVMIGGKGDDVYVVDQACESAKGNEGLGNGEDPPPPGHDTNQNDGPGSSPGHPGGSQDCAPQPYGDTVVEAAGGGWDLVATSVSYVLPQNVEAVMLTGKAKLSATGNAANNVLVGNAAASTLDGGDGNDVLAGRSAGDTLIGGKGNDKLYGEAGNDSLDGGVGNDKLWGGAGNDTIKDSEGDNLAAGGAGDDTITLGSGRDVVAAGAGNDKVSTGAGNDVVDGAGGNDSIDAGAGNDFIAGGKGNDTIIAGTGRDVIAFNRGDGKDVLKSTAGDARSDIISLGGGIRYADLTLRKSGSDLVLGLGAGDQITAKDWYSGTDSRSISALQMLTEGGDYKAGSASELTANKVVVFDFNPITAQFDAARQSNRSLTDWAVAPALATAVVEASDTQARGGDLAYDYATHYGSTQSYGKDMDETAMRAEASDLSAAQSQSVTPASAADSKLVDPWEALQAGTDLVVSTTPVASNPITPIESTAADALLFAAVGQSDQKPSWATK